MIKNSNNLGMRAAEKTDGHRESAFRVLSTPLSWTIQHGRYTSDCPHNRGGWNVAAFFFLTVDVWCSNLKTLNIALFGSEDCPFTFC